MANYFVFNGQSSLELGIRIKNKNIYSSGKRDLSLVSVPGRDGDLVNSNKRFVNSTVSYTCFVPASSIAELNTKIRNVKKWLFVDSDQYHELTDSYDPTFLRYAIFNSKLDIADEANRIGTFTVSFSCKPLRYLLSSLTAVEVATGNTLYNPFPFASKPYIKITGSGNITLTIVNSKGTKTYTFNNVSSYVECDSELMNCYKGTTLKNSDFIADNFPLLEYGDNTITYSGSVSKVEIIPRWWCL